MHPNKVRRDQLKSLTDLPNVGKSIAGDLANIGIRKPQELSGRDPFQLFEQLCHVTGHRHDPCVIDVFISLVRFVDGEAPQPWWHYTAERKQRLEDLQNASAHKA